MSTKSKNTSAKMPAKHNVTGGKNLQAKTAPAANNYFAKIEKGLRQIESLVTGEKPMSEILSSLGYVRGLVEGAFEGTTTA